jgi:hypothetical protein
MLRIAGWNQACLAKKATRCFQEVTLYGDPLIV